MSVYFNKRREWWEYYFRYKKQPYTGAGFPRKKNALAAEAERKKEVKKPPKPKTEKTDMAFSTLLNQRLDNLQAYRTYKHYEDNVYMAKRWAKKWKDLTVHQVTPGMISAYLVNIRKTISAYTANKELGALRAMWNFGIKPPNRWFIENPTDGIEFFPVEKKVKYVPPMEDVKRVILAAEGETQDYLWAIALTLGRMSEVNRLEWKDVDFENKSVKLYTRKSKGGNLVPRTIPMCKTLKEVLERRLKGNRTPWVFWHTYYSRKVKEWVTGPYAGRKRIMTTLCKKAQVKYFRFHPLRHFGASMLVNEGVDPKTIQELLGHSNFKTTELYLHLIKGSDQDAMNRLDSKLNGVENVLEFKKRKTKAQD